MPSKDEVLKALSACIEPELGRDIVSLDMVRDLRVEGSTVEFEYVLTTPACPLKDRMESEARAAVMRLPGVEDVRIRMVADVRKDLRLERALPGGIKNLVAVGSGKGGVGKSSVAANLAVSLARDGAKVGLMDADVYGPNQPQMFGISEFRPTAGPDNKIDPPEAHGVKVFSMGFLLEPDAPAIWRGPMLHGAITQFLRDVRWGELDYLVVDLPPGTGDVQLSLCQSAPITGAVVVTTPQTIALSDVRKAVGMFRKLNVPILGVVENMSEFLCPHCKAGTRIFGEGGAESLSRKFRIPFLGAVPLDAEICRSGEEGAPMVLARPESESARALRLVSRQVAAQVSLQNHGRRQIQIDLVSRK